MKKNEKVLLLRYSDFHGVDTIGEHIATLKNTGFTWWAKLGKQPRDIYLKEFFDQEEPTIMLYTANVLHICKCSGYAKENPIDGYPKYYERDIFANSDKSILYFKLDTIEKIELSFLENYIVRSSEKEVLYDLKKTISSYMFIQHKDAPRKPKPEKKIERKKEKVQFDKKSCVYKKDNICDNKYCVNYKYECAHPDICIKQKMKKR